MHGQNHIKFLTLALDGGVRLTSLSDLYISGRKNSYSLYEWLGGSLETVWTLWRNKK